MVELLKTKTMDIEALRKERSQVLSEENLSFQLNEMLLDVIEQEGMQDVAAIEVCKTLEEDVIVFEDVEDEEGNLRTIRCSNVRFLVHRCGETEAEESGVENETKWNK